MLKEKTISKEDIDLMKLTDDPQEVLSVINAHMGLENKDDKKIHGEKRKQKSQGQRKFDKLG